MTIINGFKLLDEKEIQELNTAARLYSHVGTGAQLLSLINDDENKVFGLVFRTPPDDSTGIAHIMEHSVLCGSEKYPLKEPFIELSKGSLNTFLNAFTYPDKTCYPVASQNLQDFYNLIDVYVDAVFHPLIPPHILQQEGWHFELDEVQEPLTYKGVVFNEMKGAYSSPDNTLARHSMKTLFPDNTYGVDSGGDPQEIPNLTYAQFKSFHERYYHPSNAYIFFYGDDDPDERLRLMEDYLKDFVTIEIDSTIKLQPNLDEARRFVVPYDPGEAKEEEKGMVTVNWLLTGGDPDTGLFTPEIALGWSILSYILVGTPASPLRKALIDSGLGEDVTGAGFDGQLRQPYFSTGLKGVSILPGAHAQDEGRFQVINRVEKLIFQTLDSLVQEGIDPDMIAAAVNTTEFQLRENNTGSFPRGLLLMLRALTTWLYDGDPISRLAYEAPLEIIKERLETNDRYFEALINNHLLNNSHRTTVILNPETGLQEREEAAEKERLANDKDAMTEKDLVSVIGNTRRLKEIQEAVDPPEVLATIPSLTLSDLDREVRSIPIDVDHQDGYEILYHDLFTNGILYLDVGLNLHILPKEYIPYVSLFGRSLLEMGTESEDFVKLSQRIGRTTGGILPLTFTSAIQGREEGVSRLFMRGKATTAQVKDLLAILRDVLLTVRLDNQERFRQMVLEEKASLEASLVPGGHRYVNARIRAMFSETGWASEQMNGVSYLFFLRELANMVEKDWSKVLEVLESMRRILVNRRAMVLNATLDRQNWLNLKAELLEFMGSLPAENFEAADWSSSLASRNEGLTIPAQVNYVGKGANLYKLGYKMDGSISVINNYLRTTWIWDQVRVQGGAYGGFCLFNHQSGVYTFLSYRDPNTVDTLDIYDRTGSYLRQLDQTRLSQDELTKSIIGVIGDMDAYQLPDAKGYSSMVRYLTGETDAIRQQRRDQILSTTNEDFNAFAEVLDRLREEGLVVVMGSAEAIRSVNNERDQPLEIKQVL
jgi:Zn-dependent M16 (insulinase) family peptidase